MGMKALGTYLRELRKGQGMTQAYVAGQTGMNPSTLHRIEKGEVEPGGENVLNLISVVRGSYDDARRLWSDSGADEEEARKLAKYRLTSEQKQAHKLVNGFTADELAAIRAELASDPAFVDRILDATAREILRRQR
jgi:transcriptional regulator with XRE-family HTH domain